MKKELIIYLKEIITILDKIDDYYPEVNILGIVHKTDEVFKLHCQKSK